MNFSSLTESDVWPRVARAIYDERTRRIEGLLHIQSIEAMRLEQGFIEALDWVVAESKPKPERTEKEDEE